MGAEKYEDDAPLLGGTALVGGRRRRRQWGERVVGLAVLSVSLGFLGTRRGAHAADAEAAALASSYPMLTHVAALSGASTDFWLVLALWLLAFALAGLVASDARDARSRRRGPSSYGSASTSSFQLTKAVAVAPDDAPLAAARVGTTTTTTEAAPVARHAALVAAYVAAAIGIVYVNAHVLHRWRFPATLTFLQMTFCSCAAWAACAGGLADAAAVGVTRRLYATAFLPLAALYAVFLYGSNAVYAYLPVGYIQVLKVSQAFVVYVLLLLAGEEVLAWRPALNLAIVLGSVAVAAVARAELAGWSGIGFALMMVSNTAYASYLVGQQLLVTGRATAAKARPLDALTTLYFLGPPTALALGACAATTEWLVHDFTWAGAPRGVIACDCALAFALNLIQIRIVKDLSALAYMFAGYLKGFLVVFASVAFCHESTDAVEVAAYGIMLAGQVTWSLRKLRREQHAPPVAAAPRARFSARV